MWLVEGLLELIAPTRCGGCELPGAVLCEGCRTAGVHSMPSACCPACGAPFGGLVCTECWNTQFAFSAAVSAGELKGPLARAVVLHKDAGELRLGPVLGELVAGAIPASWVPWAHAVSWVPATEAARRKRGFDHAHSIASRVATSIGVPCDRLLARGAARDQRLLGRGERKANAAESFRAVGVMPGHVVLVDDVFTTGATLEAASLALLAAGAEEVRVAVVARAW